MERIFKIINGKGEVKDLLDHANFGYKPEGLGLSFSNSFYGAGANYIFLGSMLKQSQFSIRLLFGADESESYGRFAQFIQFLNHPPLRLSYTTEGSDEYFRDFKLAEISKSEKTTFGVLDEVVTLDFMTPWYQWETGALSVYEDQAGDGKIYVNQGATEGFYVYEYAYEDNLSEAAQFFRLENNSIYLGSASSSPLDITVEAVENEIVNPMWTLQQDGRLLQGDRYFLTIPVGGKLIVSSNPHDQKTILIDANGVESNVYQAQDITMTNFVTAPAGKSILNFSNITGATVSYRLKKEVVVV
ncbi:TPA: phage distal tail protein domain-containing protein [Streptococcus suis]